MSIFDQWYLSDPFDNNGNDIYGWHFTRGERYSGPTPKEVKIVSFGKKFPISFGGLNIPYIRRDVLDVIINECNFDRENFPLIIDEEIYELVNFLNVIKAVHPNSKIEKDDNGKIKYIWRLILDKKKIPQNCDFFRIEEWPEKLYASKKVKDILKNSNYDFGLRFDEITVM
jgi:hypothetical protein